jgi:uncharacterized BrkB/YihY/UPF0761 family membrane protein
MKEKIYVCTSKICGNETNSPHIVNWLAVFLFGVVTLLFFGIGILFIIAAPFVKKSITCPDCGKRCELKKYSV